MLGPEHPDTASSLNNLGALLQTQGQLAEAQPYYARALAIWEKVLGPEHPNTALSLNNLAELYRMQGRYAEALPFYQRALASREKTLGPEHDDTLSTMNTLAASSCLGRVTWLGRGSSKRSSSRGAPTAAWS